MKKAADNEGNSERWLLTYSDLITLLMIFFVVMYSMSNVDAQKYSQLSSSLNVAMGSGGKNIIGVDSKASVTDTTKAVDNVIVPEDAAEKAEANKLSQLKKQVDSYLSSNGLGTTVNTSIQERGLIISIRDTLFFDSGSAELNVGYKQKLTELGKLLRNIDNYIVVEGNTDNVPISTYQFKDNWSLASERANNVARVLISESGIQPDRVAARSNGEFRPVSSNSTEDGRAKNRRVDIVILDNKYNQTETSQGK